MPYNLVLTEPEPAAGGPSRGDAPAVGAARGVTRVFLKDLPDDYKVFLLYFRAAMPNRPLEDGLTQLGDNTGKNLLVNFGSAADDDYDLIVGRFNITQFPVIIMTAIPDLASPAGAEWTAYAKLDSKELLKSPERTVECAEKLFNLFMQRKIVEAISQAKWSERSAMASAVLHVIGDGLKAVGGFLANRDISVSVLEGKFELKHSGA